MLLLLPNLLDLSSDHTLFLPKTVDEALFEVEGLFAEDEKNGRMFLKRFTFSRGRTFRDIPIKLLNEHTKPSELVEYVELSAKQTWGLISDCGLPCMADPGASLVRLLNQKKIPVKTFVGPSAIVMAIQLCGMYAQSFSFLGYLPKEIQDLEKKLKLMEKEVLEQRLQVFIEAPYRNQKLLEALVKVLPPHFSLCIACDLTLPSQVAEVHSIKDWKGKDLSVYQKRPAVFVLGKL